MNKQTVLNVTGMSCTGCAGNVKRALKGVNGVSYVSVDLKDGKAMVEYDPLRASDKDLAGAVTRIGYGINL